MILPQSYSLATWLLVYPSQTHPSTCFQTIKWSVLVRVRGHGHLRQMWIYGCTCLSFPRSQFHCLASILFTPFLSFFSKGYFPRGAIPVYPTHLTEWKSLLVFQSWFYLPVCYSFICDLPPRLFGIPAAHSCLRSSPGSPSSFSCEELRCPVLCPIHSSLTPPVWSTVGPHTLPRSGLELFTA